MSEGTPGARCPTCGRKHSTPTPPRKRTCWACGCTFMQTIGRRRIVCDSPLCQAKRKHYRREGGATLERL